MNSFITSYNKNESLYQAYLTSINGIKFTFREIDIIACIIHNRGEKKIASICGIAPTTVSTHTRNIMGKLECHSKDQIIDFIEKTGISKLFKEYYLHLLVRSDFEQALKNIAAKVNRQSVNCYCSRNLITNAPLLYQAIKKHLKFANITILESDDDTADINLNNVREESYYQDLSLVLLHLKDNRIKIILSEFERKYHSISKMYDGETPIYIQSKLFDSLWRFIKDQKQRKYIIAALVLIVTFAVVLPISFIVFSKNRSTQSITSTIIHSDLIIPEKALLERPDIISKMEEKLRSNTGNIKTIALTGIIGVGGAGKTTMARTYGKRVSNADVVWELNAETKDTLINSFQDLAYALAHDEELKKELKTITSNNNQELQEKLLLNFVRAQLRTKQSWLLIYDNIESFDSIAHLFPQDQAQWGKNGNIIVTTRNENLIKTGFINDEDVIYIDKLSDQEMLSLFSKILYDCEFQKLQEEDQLKAAELLKALPPFPLDVSLAAYYMKNYMLSFEDYSKLIESSSTTFDDKQARILNEATKYTRTRYGIISSTIKQLTQTNPKFKELFFFISVLDSQNIPYALLNEYYPVDDIKHNTISINEFVFALRKHGLIIRESIDNSTSNVDPAQDSKVTQTLSLHRSMQAIGGSYLLNTISKEDQALWLERSVLALKNYYHKCEQAKDNQSIISLLFHLEFLLDQVKKINLSQKLKNKFEAEIYLMLGEAHYKFLGNITKARSCFKQALASNEISHCFTALSRANILKDLGKVSTLTSNYQEALDFNFKSIDLCKLVPNTAIIIADNLQNIGITYSKIGHFVDAKAILEKALKLLTNNTALDSAGLVAEINSQLGNLYILYYLHKKEADLAKTYLVKAYDMFAGINNNAEQSDEICCRAARYRWRYGLYFLWHEMDYIAAAKWIKSAEYILLKKCPDDLYFKARLLGSLGTILLRTNNLSDANTKLTEAIDCMNLTIDTKATYIYKALRAEVRIRLQQFQDGYEDAIFLIQYNIEQNPMHRLRVLASFYHAAFAKHKLGNNQKSLEHFENFVKQADVFCKSFLEPSEYEKLLKENVFIILPKDQKNEIKNITTYLLSSLKIFTAIYGEQHTFVKDYIAKNYYETLNENKSFWYKIKSFIKGV